MGKVRQAGEKAREGLSPKGVAMLAIGEKLAVAGWPATDKRPAVQLSGGNRYLSLYHAEKGGMSIRQGLLAKGWSDTEVNETVLELETAGLARRGKTSRMGNSYGFTLLGTANGPVKGGKPSTKVNPIADLVADVGSALHGQVTAEKKAAAMKAVEKALGGGVK